MDNMKLKRKYQLKTVESMFNALIEAGSTFALEVLLEAAVTDFKKMEKIIARCAIFWIQTL